MRLRGSFDRSFKLQASPSIQILDVNQSNLLLRISSQMMDPFMVNAYC
jgi:hypothetical protein